MDANVQRLLTDKLYDKRKQGALELEKLIRDSVAARDHERIRKVIDQLCHEYAYAVHQTYARNGGLIGLAAASIALGSEEVARYLNEIIPPVLACFTDQDARVRYYACEAMYNISKVAKGEVLVYFNLIFDALCKLSADSELSVKNGAELLDRLVKDIVSESAVTYVSILNYDELVEKGGSSSEELPTAFSLRKFIPLLEERIWVLNPFTRQFLVEWLKHLNQIPDLELVHFLPSFLGGLFKFLGDQNKDVVINTQLLLDVLLAEIVKIAKVKKNVAESRRSRHTARRRTDSASQVNTGSPGGSVADDDDDNAVESQSEPDEEVSDGLWVPGQDVEIDHAAILDILLKFVDPSAERKAPEDFILRMEGLGKQKEEEIGLVALRWIETFFEVASEDILPYVPRLLGQVLPALASQSDAFASEATNVNRALIDYVMDYQDQMEYVDISQEVKKEPPPSTTSSFGHAHQKSLTAPSDIDVAKPPQDVDKPLPAEPEDAAEDGEEEKPKTELDYAEAVRILQLQLLHEKEETRVAAINWLRLLHKKAPRKVLALHDGTFPVLLKTLSDSAEAVVIQDLSLLSQLSKHTEDDYFSSFMVALLQLFSTDRKLLEIRGNLIIRQLCINMKPERIYRTFADCIEKDEDIEFSSIMVQNLNNNLITAPELSELRKRLRNIDNKEGQAFFVALFKAWSHNAVATFSLCLLAQAYEQAYSLLQIFADIEMTVNMLIQIDKLVQLLESPVFTFLRIQLLEPERYPYLYKCLYGLLMLLPQSSAFAALKNRLNSVSAIALLHTPPPQPGSARTSVAAGSSIPGSSSSTVGRLAGRREPGSINTTGEVKWSELLEKFRGTQEKARKRSERLLRGDDEDFQAMTAAEGRARSATRNAQVDVPEGRTSRASGRQSIEIGRPGSRLSLEQGRTGPAAGLGFRQFPPPNSRPIGSRTERFDPANSSATEPNRPTHKSRNSIIGKLGISRNSKDRDKKEEKPGGPGPSSLKK